MKRLVCAFTPSVFYVDQFTDPDHLPEGVTAVPYKRRVHDVNVHDDTTIDGVLYVVVDSQGGPHEIKLGDYVSYDGGVPHVILGGRYEALRFIPAAQALAELSDAVRMAPAIEEETK